MHEQVLLRLFCWNHTCHLIKLVALRFSRDIQRLWKIAGQRYNASQQQLQFTVGSYSIYDDLPTDLDQVSVTLLLHLMLPTA